MTTPTTTPFTPRFTDAEVRAAMAAVVADRGDRWTYAAEYEAVVGGPFHQAACRYVARDGTGTRRPLCLIGQVLARLLPDEWRDLDFVRHNAPPTDRFYSDSALLLFTGRCREALTAAQSAQDTGRTWSECLNEFDRVLLAGAM